MYTRLEELHTFREWSELLLRKKRVQVSPVRMILIESYLEHLNYYIGDQLISEIKPFHIDEIIAELSVKNPRKENKPMSKSGLKDLRNIASQVFDLAIENDILNKNPAKDRKIPRHAVQNKVRALKPIERQWIINTYHKLRAGALIMMFAGLRRGELIPLTWLDVNLVENSIQVNKSVYQIHNTFVIKEGTKSQAGTRIIPIPKTLSTELQKEKYLASSNYISAQANGRLHTPSSWKSLWSSYICTLNAEHGFQEKQNKHNPNGIPRMIDKINPHMLRHTYATMLYSSGVDLLTASKLLGHADIDTTLKIYTELDEVIQNKSIVKFDNYVQDLFSKNTG